VKKHVSPQRTEIVTTPGGASPAPTNTKSERRDPRLFHFERHVGEFAVTLDLHCGGFARFQGGEGVAEFVDGFDLFAVERMNDVACAQAGVDGETIGDDGRDEHSGWNAHVAED
jgi:hypothetical protein